MSSEHRPSKEQLRQQVEDLRYALQGCIRRGTRKLSKEKERRRARKERQLAEELQQYESLLRLADKPTVYILVRSVNEYDQYGSYFTAWWPQKPTREELEKFTNHFGRKNFEHTWYELYEVPVGHRFDHPEGGVLPGSRWVRFKELEHGPTMTEVAASGINP